MSRIGFRGTSQVTAQCRLRVSAALKRKAPKQVACSKTLTSAPGRNKQLEQMCNSIYSYSTECRKDPKSGIVAFEFFKDPHEEGTFHFWEVYETDQAFSQHTTSTEMKAFLEKSSAIVKDSIGISLYEIKDGKIGVSSIAEGPKGEGGLEDATGAGSVGGAGYTQTSPVVNLIRDEEEKKKDKLWGIEFNFPWFKKKKE
mmetsp:Transcript_6621/g.13145  ORF Transcript_6621/g.13145 Transcript_6621/m.13145 type:complete len:199 (-) Transcript_6621:576-1172(-)